ncbi:MAG: hypothetical protein E7590_08425 [Ruminococcaceae bacterium]|nr:hypothetical protein [Oscillospiraceae bacterium]
MRRLLSICMLLCLLLSCAAALLPLTASAESALDWNKIYYRQIPQTEGETHEQVRLTTGAEIPGACTLEFDASKTGLKVNDKAVQPGEQLTKAGEYELLLTNLANETQQVIYTVKLLPDINVKHGDVFTTYPTITCSNAEKVTYQTNLDFEVPIASGDQIRQFGRFIICAYGKNKNGHDVKFEYVIYIKVVHAVETFDPQNGHALNVTVGSFDDYTVEATLDGQPLAEGPNVVTEVGAHELNVKLNGAYYNNLNAMPDAESLFLRISIDFSSLEQRSPYYFDFTGWNAKILLDGKEVKGQVRVAKNGKHTLEALDADGKRIEGAFRITTDANPTPQRLDTVTFRFRNPNFIIAIISGVLAIGVFAFAAYLFVARRRLV